MKTSHPPHEEFYHATLFLSMLFRIFVIIIILAFVTQRVELIFAEIAVVAFVLAIFIFSDIYLTLRILFDKKRHFTLSLLYGLIKILIILIVVIYAVKIWLAFLYWPYAAFALFVVFLFALDFIIVSKLERISKRPVI